ncbi:unnamed protein product [Rangifer tarandus platyrhynchus]|uniref:Uncharacterized protein n=1 Tax=Rangifer tarandus platyrhynchus TaxID=3082113 RepID=A0AC59YWE0_RANTA
MSAHLEFDCVHTSGTPTGTVSGGPPMASAGNLPPGVRCLDSHHSGQPFPERLVERLGASFPICVEQNVQDVGITDAARNQQMCQGVKDGRKKKRERESRTKQSQGGNRLQ